jgi:hypothetical protein
MQGKLFIDGWQKLLQCIVDLLHNIQKLWNLNLTLLSRQSDKMSLKHSSILQDSDEKLFNVWRENL